MNWELVFNKPLPSWMCGGGPDSDIVLSSRVRLARNLSGVPFPGRASKEQLNGVLNRLHQLPERLQELDGTPYYLFEMEQLSLLQRMVLVEKHVVSPQYAAEPAQRALLVREDTGASVMINEEDHLRMQCMTAGLDLETVLQQADRLDDAIEAETDMAFTENLGYLTSCPTNLGTGLRASAMLHLPALVITRQVGRIVAVATQLGLAVRGLYGEGTEAVGNVFQISNQLTIGYSEQEIIGKLNSVVRRIVDRERSARQLLVAESIDSLADRVWRAYGILCYARSLTGQEALTLLSEVRLGIDAGIINQVPAEVFNELLVTTRPNYLQKMLGETELDSKIVDRLRSDLVRKKLGGKEDV
ncbi:MAG TPA: protein arginine kinase [Patescibacteria group bacterium]|nr:protein arginine kinase [Patescibacteria group bacterium]